MKSFKLLSFLLKYSNPNNMVSISITTKSLILLGLDKLFTKFFKLYKEISNPALGTLDSLKDLLHQFELNKQYYVSFYLSFVPFFVCAANFEGLTTRPAVDPRNDGSGDKPKIFISIQIGTPF